MKFMFSPVEFRSIASVGVAASTDKVTPIINVISLSFDGKEVRALATDRYRIAQSKFMPSVEQLDEAGEFTVNMYAPTVTKFWNSIKANALKGNEVVMLELIPSDLGETYFRLSHGGNIVTEAETRGNFPPVEKLINVDMQEYKGIDSIALDPRFIGDLSKLFAADDFAKPIANIGWTFHFGKSDSDKPKPVYITRKSDRGGAVIDYLVQPRILR